MDTLFFDIQSTSQETATKLIYGLTAMHISVFSVCIFILDLIIIRRFRKKQAAMLEIFRMIPFRLKHEKLTV
jgi:hypothetical protein